MNDNQKRRVRPLAVIVGASAATALFALTPSFEGERLTTYRDIAGVLTYCDGATESAQWGKTYTPAECRAQLERDLARHAEGIGHCVKMDELTEGQRIAFVDAAYNIGVENFCSSSMARKASAGDLAGSCDALLAWDHAGGRRVEGLARRRQAERRICLGEK